MINKLRRKALAGALFSALALGACLDPGDPGNLVPKTVVEDPTLPRIALAGTQLHSEAYGDPSSPMVVVLHGGPGQGSGPRMRRGFDPAFSLDMPKPDRGIGHAFLRPAESLTDFTTPIVPVFLNCYYAPQPTALRCYQLGAAVREIVAEHPADLRVAVVGSGGLWHTPRAKDAYLDEAFDRAMLDAMRAGDARTMARHFDAYVVPPGDASQLIGAPGPGATGLLDAVGPRGGTRETCNWIAAAAVADGRPATIVDYVPIYASPIGAAFAYWR